MRILFVTNNYTPYSGGVVSSIQSTVQQLQKEGHTVRIVTLNFLGKDHSDPSFVRRIPSLVRFKRKQNHIAVPWRMRSFLKKELLYFKPDIIHVHHPFLLGPCSLKLAQLYNIPIVFTYHTIYEAYAHYVPLPALFTRNLIKKKAIAFCNKVDMVIAPSQAIADEINHAGVQTSMVVIPSAIKSHFLLVPFAFKKVKDSFSLLSVGRFTPEKNMKMVINLFAQLPQDGSFALTLVGYGSLEQELRTHAFEKYGLSKELVKFVIKPSSEQLITLYKEADLFIFTSITDTQGLVLAESMSQATPVVAVNGPGQRAIIKNGENGFLVHDINEMKNKIKEISVNSLLHQLLQKNAWNKAQEYSAKKCVGMLISLYENILSR